MITIVSPSWKRPTKTITHTWFPDIKYVVCESQAQSYKDAGCPMLVCPDSAQGNVSRVRNWILDNCGPYVVIMDDDVRWLARWESAKRKKLSVSEVYHMLEVGFQLAEDLETPMWGINIIKDKQAYNEFSPFSVRAMVLGPFQAFRKMDLRYDEGLPLKEDYDLSLQVLNKYRKTLRLNCYYYNADQHINLGGCADYRTMERELEQFHKLQRKWGSKIVYLDTHSRKSLKNKTHDINPIIRIPI